MYKKLLKLAAWKKILIAVVLGLITFVGWFVYEITTDEPPNFFPLNDVQAEYRGNNVQWKEDHSNSNFFSITIGKSNIDLESYIGKKVKNLFEHLIIWRLLQALIWKDCHKRLGQFWPIQFLLQQPNQNK